MQAIASAAAVVALTEGAFLLTHYGSSTALANFDAAYGEMPAVMDACSHSLHVLRHFQLRQVNGMRRTTGCVQGSENGLQAMESSDTLGTVKKDLMDLRERKTDGCMREPWNTVMQILKLARANNAKERCLLVILHAEALEEALHTISLPKSRIRQLQGEQPVSGEPLQSVCVCGLYLCCPYACALVLFLAHTYLPSTSGALAFFADASLACACLSARLHCWCTEEHTSATKNVLLHRFKPWPKTQALPQICCW